MHSTRIEIKHLSSIQAKLCPGTRRTFPWFAYRVTYQSSIGCMYLSLLFICYWFWHLYLIYMYIYIAKWSSFPPWWCRWRREWPLSRRKAHATIRQLVLFIAERTSSHCKFMSTRQSCRNWYVASNRHVHAVWKPIWESWRAFTAQHVSGTENERDTKLCIGDYHTIKTNHTSLIRMFWLPNSRPPLNSLLYYVQTHPYHACSPLIHVVVLVNPISNQYYQNGSIKYWKTRMRICKSTL